LAIFDAEKTHRTSFSEITVLVIPSDPRAYKIPIYLPEEKDGITKLVW